MSLLEDPKAGGGGEERARLVVCPFCGYDTDRKNNLKRHIQTMHEASEVELECCGQRFYNKADMRAHTRALHRNGYTCPVCHHVFCRKALLKRHLSVHTGIKDFICSLCAYDTSHKSNLERHMRTHAKAKEAAKDVIQDEEPLPALTSEQAMRHGPLLEHAASWPPRSQPSPQPPTILRYRVHSRPRPARLSPPPRKFSIEALLPTDPGRLYSARPALGRLTKGTINFGGSILRPPRPSPRVLRPIPIRPVKDLSRRLPEPSIVFQGRHLAVVSLTPPASVAFAPPPPPLPPHHHPPLCVTPPYLPAVPHASTSSFSARSSPPPLQFIGNASPSQSEAPAFAETPPPESPESPGRVSSPEEHQHVEGEEYVHKKLRFSRKLRQVELCSGNQQEDVSRH